MAGPTLLQPGRFQGDVDGKPVALYTLRNTCGMVCSITNYGAKITQLLVPDRNGQLGDVVLGYDSLEGVMSGSPSMGAFIGRYAGRIGNAAFTLDGVRHQLTANNGPHCLHGGVKGSRFRVFDAVQHNPSSVEMRHVFADGEEGFPGTLALSLKYSLTDNNELVLSYEATARDKPTVASFTTHAFFNLNGHASGSVLDHDVTVFADEQFGMTDDLVATGELLPVTGTPFDFRESRAVNSQGQGGYDCCYLLSNPVSNQLTLAAQVSAPASGRVMQVWSTEPALQFYTGLSPGEPMAGGPGKEAARYLQQQSLCLEPQGYPNAPKLMHRYPDAASAVYAPGVSRSGQTVYGFSSF
jgi:aldose 1-epimerase